MNPPRVLLIEDDSSIRRYVELAWDDQPIELLHAPSLRQALEMVRHAGPFRLIITDLMLPDGSGIQLLQSLASEPALRAGAYLAVFSAGLSAERRRELSGLGVDEVIAKPATLADLLGALERGLAVRPPPRPGGAEAGKSGSAAVARYFAGDLDLYTAYRAQCLRQFPLDRQAGDLALATGDLATVRRLTHSLKTVLQTLGHDEESSLARELEVNAADGRPDRVMDGWRELARALDRLAHA